MIMKTSNNGKNAHDIMISGGGGKQNIKLYLWFGYSFAKTVFAHEQSQQGNSEK